MTFPRSIQAISFLSSFAEDISVVALMLAVRCLRTATKWTSVIRIIAVPLNGSLILHFMGVDSGMSIVKHNCTFLPINCHWLELWRLNLSLDALWVKRKGTVIKEKKT